MKRFNYTGICIPEKHYMADVSKKIDKIVSYIDYGDYFVINRPRQYGKTTTLYLIERRLRDKYVLIFTSFEGKGELIFETEEEFSKEILKLMFEKLMTDNEEIKKKIESEVKEYANINEVSDAITRIIKKIDKKVVLLIDEVDRASNHVLFLNFLGMLRNKFLSASRGADNTFHSVVLAGVHDIKNIKMKMRDERESQYNSPWNIAINFNVDMSLSIEEISTMLAEYEDNNKTGMDVQYLSERIYDYTGGYPYLVSRLCYLIDEELDRNFTENGLEEAVKIILNENNTLFDDLIKNINKFEELYNLVERIVLDGNEISYNPYAHQIGIMYGVFREQKNKLKIHNRIFEIQLYNYMIAMRETNKGTALTNKYIEKFVDKSGNLNMELVLEKFQELMKAEYREVDEKFVEREGRLLFLAFLKPIINGTGFYFVEAETRMSNRMDIVVTFNKEKFVIELKIWRGGKYEQEGREQLCEYLEAQNLSKGYMIFYSFNKGKEYTKERLNVGGKEIFEIGV